MLRRIRAPADGCVLIASNSAAVSRAGLAQHLVGHADLADVVQQRAEAQDLDRLGVEPELLADGDRRAR